MLVLFVAPYYTDNAKLFLRQLLDLPKTQVGLISQEPEHSLPDELRSRLVGHYRVDDAFRSADLLQAASHMQAASHIGQKYGPIERLLGAVEQLQVPMAEVRATLQLRGMNQSTAHNFRDKTRMKDVLRAADVPVARHRQIASIADALRFAAEVSFPLVVKPPAGAAAQTTYRVENEEGLRRAVAEASRVADGVALLEEFVTGQEHSFDAFVKDGEVLFYSVSNYYPTPLEVMEHPWMQWVVVLPREYESPDILAAAGRTLSVLGLETGMCHLEWFRRKDGSLVISEVGARPPGAQFCTLIGRAHEIDCVQAWARLVARDEFSPVPARKFATGGAYLRGQGEGRVQRVSGLDHVEREVGALITDRRIPSHNQEKSKSYEGEGFILVRHPDTQVVKDALDFIVSTVKVELS